MEQQPFKISVSPFSKRNIGICLLSSHIGLTSYVGKEWSNPQEAEARSHKTILFSSVVIDSGSPL